MKKLVYSSIFLLLLLLSGCWDYQDVGHLDLVSGMGIDRGEDGAYQVTLEIAGMSGGGAEESSGDAPTPLLVSGQGETLVGALRDITASVANELFYNHCKALVIGEEAARDGIGAIVDTLTRNSETYLGMPVFVSKGTTAAEIFEARPVGAPLVASQLGGSLKLEARVLGAAPRTPVFMLADGLQTPGFSVTLPAVTRKEEEETVYICGTAVFKGQNLKGFLSAQDSADFLLAAGKLSGGVLTVRGGHTVGEEILDSRVKTEVQDTQKPPRFMITVSVTAAISEPGDQAGVRFAGAQDIALMEKQAADVITGDVTAVITKVQQEWGTDILGLGALLARQQPAVWTRYENQWDEIFKKTQVTVDTRVTLRDSQCKLR